MLQNFSHNILGVVFKFMEPKEILQAGLICKNVWVASKMDHIWRLMALRIWTFVRQRYGETWQNAFKRKLRSKAGIKGGKPSQFEMTPLRVHKGYISALEADEHIIVSGDSIGHLFAWFEDESKYKDEDPEPFTPLPLVQSAGQISSIIIHTSKRYITALSNPNVLQILAYNEEEKVVVPHKTITSELPIISSLGAYLDNVLAFPPSTTAGHILLYGCESGTCLLKIPYKGLAMPAIVPHFGGPGVRHAAALDAGKPQFAVWNNDLFLSYGENTPGGLKYFVEKFSLTGKKVAATRALPGLCSHLQVSGNRLFVYYNNQILIFDTTNLQPLGTHQLPVGLNLDYVRMINNGPKYTVHLINKYPFRLVSIKYDDQRKKFDATQVQVDTAAGHKEAINFVDSNESNMVTASADMTIGVWDLATGHHLYRLLGGSRMIKISSFVDNPYIPGFSIVRIGASRIIGVLGNLIRVYSFDVKDDA